VCLGGGDSTRRRAPGSGSDEEWDCEASGRGSISLCGPHYRMEAAFSRKSISFRVSQARNRPFQVADRHTRSGSTHTLYPLTTVCIPVLPGGLDWNGAMASGGSILNPLMIVPRHHHFGATYPQLLAFTYNVNCTHHDITSSWTRLPT
jgi:hypothetical protein